MRSHSKSSALCCILACFQFQSITAQVTESQDYGIGFQFTPAYGSVAVSYENGSNVALGRVNGDKAWHNLMFKLCVDTRYMRYSEGDTTLEADRLILVEMVHSLAELAAARLGEPVKAAAVSLPAHNRVHHYGEFAVAPILRNAFETAGLEYLPIITWDAAMGEPLIFAENAIVAGHGFGLCQPYTAGSECKNGTRAPYDVFYLIGYFQNELEITRTSRQWSAYQSWWYGYPSEQHLGRDSKHDNPDEEHYWDAVRQRLIKSFPPTGHLSYNMTKLVFYGDHAGDPRLRLEVAKVLQAFGQEPKLIDDGIDPVYAGALGVADFAKRRPYFDIETRYVRGLVDQTKPDM
ncbi:hypothetical protein B0A48_11858 [Cryoendolithus antarcticus]|uniref:Uncharacterized protein n=1 Tax=Cryoendolithus antarcticus TaxID=1507870 RepID=A0A1V8STE9_9PEZI|nr:hypothetical protein B0A48_11858 [Cryoendolithus antarcticus]